MKKIGLIILLAFGTQCRAEWNNPAERYLQEYKNHINATCPIARSAIKHFVYFARDREAIVDHPFLTSERFSGAQIMYTWKQLEPEKNVYDFSLIENDLTYLASKNKALFVQLQDATFHPKYRAIPEYLESDEYKGGAVPQYDQNKKIEGWVAKRWNEKVQQRFAKLLTALGTKFDGQIEGINLQETAIGVSKDVDSAFTPEGYVASVKANMAALSQSFKRSVALQYANFFPDEWLPWDDKGFLKSVYQ